MRTFFQDLLVQMKGIWSRLDAPQRLVVGVVLLATVVGLVGIVWYAGRPSYEIVYTARTSDEMTRVEQALGQAGISFTVDDTGRSFLVERTKVGVANMAISKEGLTGVQSPSLGGSTSLIEDAATKAWRLDAASRAQAEAAIRQLDGVVSVTVTASRPRGRVAYRDRLEEQKASATVVLRLRPGAPWEGTARSAASIASSQLMVPMKDIDVVSTTGGQRWSYDPDREAGGAGSSEFLALQRSLSDERTRLAQDRLDQLWPGKTAVQVTVELDPLWEIRSEKVVPEEQIVSSEEVTKDSTDSPAVAQDASAAKSKNETRNRKFVTEIGERRVGKLMPDVKRMSVAVLYDRALEGADGFNKDDLVRTVKAIVGWDPQRDADDAFSTLAGDFAPVEDVATVSVGPGFGELVESWGPTVGQILGVCVVLVFLRGLFKRTASPAAKPADALPEIPEEDLAPEEQQKRMRREIERSIANDPAALAKLLESWLMEKA